MKEHKKWSLAEILNSFCRHAIKNSGHITAKTQMVCPTFVYLIL